MNKKKKPLYDIKSDDGCKIWKKESYFSPENLNVELCPLLVTKERISNVVHLWFTRLKTEQVRAPTVYKSKSRARSRSCICSIRVHGFEAEGYKFKA